MVDHEQETTKWFTAEHGVEINGQEDDRNITQRNLILIRAETREAAYEKAIQFGSESQSSYLNPAGKQVQFRFRGICYLGPVEDDLTDGAELLYTEEIAVPEEKIQS